MKIKIFITLVSLYLTVSFAFLSTGCDESATKPDTLTADTTIDSNVLEFYNIVISEFFDNNSYSAVNLITGDSVPETDQSKDIQMRDSSGGFFHVNFFLRSGDQSFLDAGSETRFGQYIAYDNISASEFDTLSKITNLGSTLDPGDFYWIKTDEYSNPKYINAPLTNNTVYSCYLKGKSPITPIYGMIRLRSAYIVSNVFKLAIDVKLNIAGQNQFRRMTITQN